MRLSALMKKILLVLFKAEGDPKFIPSRDRAITAELYLRMEMGEISEEEMYARLRKMPAIVSKTQLIQQIKPEAVQKKELPGKVFYSIKGSVEASFTRSLKRLTQLGLISVGREGRYYVYSLTEKGRLTAEKIKKEIQSTIQEYQKLI